MTTSPGLCRSLDQTKIGTREGVATHAEGPAAAVPLVTRASHIAGNPVESHEGFSACDVECDSADESVTVTGTEVVYGHRGRDTTSWTSRDDGDDLASCSAPLETHRGPRPAQSATYASAKKTVAGMVRDPGPEATNTVQLDDFGLRETLVDALRAFHDELIDLASDGEDDTQDKPWSKDTRGTVDWWESRSDSDADESGGDENARELANSANPDPNDTPSSPDVSFVVSTGDNGETECDLKSQTAREHQARSPDSVLAPRTRNELLDCDSSFDETDDEFLLERGEGATRAEGATTAPTPPARSKRIKTVSFSDSSTWPVYDIGSLTDLSKEKNVRHCYKGEKNVLVSWFGKHGIDFLKRFGFGSRAAAIAAAVERAVRKQLRESKKNMYHNVDYNVSFSGAIDGQMVLGKERDLSARTRWEKRRRRAGAGNRRR